MIYSLLQFYMTELAGWSRIVEFRREESGELVRQVTVVLDQQNISSVHHKKESNSFIDRLMVQQQEFDHIINRITSQKQRLEKTVSFPVKPVEDLICHQQDLLRAKMQSAERNFIRLKYMCSIFLSLCLNDQVFATLKIKSKSLEYAG